MGAMLLIGSNEKHRAQGALLQSGVVSPKPFPPPADTATGPTVHAAPEHP